MAGHAPAPDPSFRLIPSRFPPIGLFDTVTRAADLAPVMELVGWTNDRLVSERLARLPPSQWVFGRANASIVMAAFLHAAPEGGRFNGPALGAWYAAGRLETAIAEVGHHLRREVFARRVPAMNRLFRCYRARLAGGYQDLRGQQTEQPGLYAGTSHAECQAFGETLRARGEDGLLYDSLRHQGGENAVAYRPTNVLDVVQAEHLELTVTAGERALAVRLVP